MATTVPHIIKFGTILENMKGQLEFYGFHINGADKYTSSDVAILSLVVQRIQRELDNLLEEKAKSNTS